MTYLGCLDDEVIKRENYRRECRRDVVTAAACDSKVQNTMLKGAKSPEKVGGKFLSRVIYLSSSGRVQAERLELRRRCGLDTNHIFVPLGERHRLWCNFYNLNSLLVDYFQFLDTCDAKRILKWTIKALSRIFTFINWPKIFDCEQN